MPILPYKTLSEIEQDVKNRLAADGVITNFSATSRAMAMAKALAMVLQEAYEVAEFAQRSSSVSVAQGGFLDKIGAPLGVQRNPGESDDNYRYRIIHRLETASGVTKEAIRLACLGVRNIRSVVLRPYTHGTGSFTVFVVTHELNQLEQAVKDVQAVLDLIVPLGIRARAEAPRIVTVDMEARVVTRSSATIAKTAAESAIRRVISRLDVGGTLFLSELIEEIRKAIPGAVDAVIGSIMINGRPALLQNQVAKFDEKFYPGVIVATAVSTQ